MAKTPTDNENSGEGAAAPDEAPVETAAPAADLNEGEQPITVNAQYTKDLSFEAPNTPGVFGLMQQEAPDIGVNVNVDVKPLQEKTFEVILEIAAECKINDQVAFILELEYAGVFTLNIPEEHMQPVLLIECPRLLFPFARNILSDVTRDGGFPPMMLGPLDFAAMFQAKLAAAEQAEASGGSDANGGGEETDATT